jgi:hypothetical protein
MPDGTVLIAGGGSLDGADHVASAERYKPTSSSWVRVTSMRTARSFHVATLMRDGTVLVAGGRDGARDSTALAELFKP